MQTGYEFLALAQEQLDDVPGAIRTLEEGRRRGILSEGLLGKLGLLYAERGDAKSARRILEPLSGSADVEVLNALGIARAGAGDRRLALEAFQRALAIDPRDAIAYQNIGIAELQFGNSREASAALDRAVALNDRLPRAWNARGVALERTGRPADALAAWKKTVEIDPLQFDALYNIGLAAGQLKQYAEARRALRDFVSHAPPDRYGAEIRRARQLLSALDETAR